VQFSPEELDLLARFRPKSASRWSEPDHNVFAWCVVDHGAAPGVGEVRLSADDDHVEALELACRLARSASVRAGMLGLPSAGGTVVIVRHPDRDVAASRRLLDQRLVSVPFGALASFELRDECEGVDALIQPEPETMRELRGRVLDACIEPLFSGKDDATTLRRALVLGANHYGRDLAEHLRGRGVQVALWDAEPSRAEVVAAAAGVDRHPGSWLDAPVDLLVPCLSIPIIDEAAAKAVQAQAIAGGVPQVFASAAARDALESRGRRFVPEPLAALADSIALAETASLLQASTALELLSRTARQVLAEPRGAQDRALDIAIARGRGA
jgi:hypothetical protein